MKTFEGILISNGMKNTSVVEVYRKTPHPLYKKLITRSKKFKVDNTGFDNLELGSSVRIVETRPISKNKYFKITGVVGVGKAKPIIKTKTEETVEEPKKEVKKTTRVVKPRVAKKEAPSRVNK
jgi:small subunit ribosomal protein S17